MIVERKNAHDEKNIKLYFRCYKVVCETYEITKENRYNINETDFGIDCSKFHIVIILKSYKKLYMTDSSNRDYITFIQCIDKDIDGFVVFIFLICADT